MPGTDRGVAIIINVDRLEYKNEAGGDPPDNPASANDDDKSSFSISSYSTHHITMDGISFYTEEFRIVDGRVVVAAAAATDATSDKNDVVSEATQQFQSMMVSSEQYHSTISNLPGDTSAEESELNVTSSDDERVVDETEDEDEDDDDEQDDEVIYSSEKIPFGQLTGQQNIRIKLKQAESIQGPKVQLEMTFGSLNIFLSPRQLHMITLFSDLFIFDTDVVAAAPQRQLQHQQRHPINDVELKRQLHRRFNEMNSDAAAASGLGSNFGWSSERMSDQFDAAATNVIVNQPTKKQYTANEFLSSMSSSMTSSMCSSVTTTTTSNTRRRGGNIDADPNADISHLNIRIGCVSMILLHEDVLVECSPTLPECPFTEQSMRRLKLMADHYFETVQGLGLVGGGSAGLRCTDVLTNATRVLEKACTNNHVRLLVTPIIVEGEEQRNARGNLLHLSLSVAQAEMVEVLDRCAHPLLTFPKTKEVSFFLLLVYIFLDRVGNRLIFLVNDIDWGGRRFVYVYPIRCRLEVLLLNLPFKKLRKRQTQRNIGSIYQRPRAVIVGKFCQAGWQRENLTKI